MCFFANREAPVPKRKALVPQREALVPHKEALVCSRSLHQNCASQKCCASPSNGQMATLSDTLCGTMPAGMPAIHSSYQNYSPSQTIEIPAAKTLSLKISMVDLGNKRGRLTERPSAD